MTDPNEAKLTAAGDVERVPGPNQGRMGERLRQARRARGLSLRELSHRLGVSASLISQVETGRANPSVSTLYAIAAELDVSLDELLFEDRRASPSRTSAAPSSALDHLFQAAESRKRIRLASGVTWDRLTPTSEPDAEFLYVTYEVGGASSQDGFQRHPGHEWGFVIDGRLEVRIGFETIVLGPGDALSFDSMTPHRLTNNGDEPVHAIWFVMGRTPSDDEEDHDHGDG